MLKELFDVTIIGGGPAGLYSAFYSGLRGMKTKIIEYQKSLGGKLHVYPEKIVWDVGGVPPVPGEVLIKQMVEQGLTFDPAVCLQTKVESISRDEDGVFLITTSNGDIHYSKTVIIAVGGGILNPKRIEMKGAEKFETANLHYSVKSLSYFKDRTVIISGGGNSAIDWAHELVPIAKRVFISCRKDSFSCHESQGEELHHSSVVCFFNSKITNFIPTKDGQAIEKVELTNHQTGITEYLPVDDVIVNHGYVWDKSLLDQSPLDIERKDDYFIAGNGNSDSSIPGLFAAGDVLMHDSKLHLIAGAFQDAANAVNLAKQWLNPDAANVAMVSSHNEKLKTKNQQLKEKLYR